VLLEVTDTGIGMDSLTQAHIFEPFFTTKEFGQGTGLGLATVYGIVKQMEGLIQVQSAPARGTTFRLHFPETRVRETAVLAASVTSSPRGDETLLLVEDEPAVRSYLTQLLERYGYHVITAENQVTALAKAQAYSDAIHLILTDVVMPGGTGPEMVRALEDLRPRIRALHLGLRRRRAGSPGRCQGESR
jgi:hypothetical protein